MEVKTNIFRPTRGRISNVLIQFFSKTTVYLRGFGIYTILISGSLGSSLICSLQLGNASLSGITTSC